MGSREGPRRGEAAHIKSYTSTIAEKYVCDISSYYISEISIPDGSTDTRKAIAAAIGNNNN